MVGCCLLLQWRFLIWDLLHCCVIILIKISGFYYVDRHFPCSADSPKTNNWCCFCLQVSFIVIHYLPSSALLAPLVGYGACNCRSTANKIENSGFLLPFLTQKSMTFIIQFKGSIVSSKWNLMGQGKIVHAHYSSLA